MSPLPLPMQKSKVSYSYCRCEIWFTSCRGLCGSLRLCILFLTPIMLLFVQEGDEQDLGLAIEIGKEGSVASLHEKAMTTAKTSAAGASDFGG